MAVVELTLDNDYVAAVRCEECSVVRRGPWSPSESRVAITDKSLVAKANRHAGSSTLLFVEPLSPGCQPLMMLLQDDHLLELLGNAMKSPFGKDLVVRDEEMVPPCDLGFESAVGGGGGEEEVVSLPSSFVKFSNGLGMSVVALEKEISLLLKKLDLRKGRGVKGSGGKKKSLPSCFEREIRKLESLVNYDCSPFIVKGKGRGAKI